MVLAMMIGLATVGATTAPLASATSDNTYPSQWANAPQDSMLDNWGEYNRECTSYVAWMLHSVNGFEMPFHGDASTWVTQAENLGYTVNTTPAAGAVGWMSIGHVAWVESVNPNGTINTEDYNYGYFSGNPGTYEEHLNQSASSFQYYIHFKDLSSSGGSQEIFTLDSSGNLSAKVGGLTSTWTLLDTGVVDFKVSPTWIVALDGSGNLSVKTSVYSPWTVVATGVSPGNFAVTNDMIAVLWGTNLYTKVGSLGAGWVLTLNPVSSFKVSASDHIAGMLTSGDLEVQWGPVGSGWVDVASNISGYDITDDIVGVNYLNNLLIKQGSVNAGWGNVMNPISNFGISPSDHIAANMTSGALNVEWGPIGSGWTGVATGYDAYGITDTRVGILQGGTLSVKEGGVDATWIQVATNVTSFAMTG